eukprot:5923824-Prymnesium_polylepis.1
MLDKLPALAQAIEQQLKQRLLEDYRTLRLPLFRMLTDRQLRVAAGACRLNLDVQPGEELIRRVAARKRCWPALCA